MKICLINNLYKPYARGGAERVAEMTAEELLKLGQEVVVISTKPVELRIENYELRIIDGVKNYYIPSFYYNLIRIPKWLRLLWHILDMFDIGSFFIIRKILKKEKVDLVITHNLKGVGYLIPLAIRSLGIKHIHTLHDIQLIHPFGLMIHGEEKKIDSVFAQIYTFLCRLLFGSPQKVVSPSQWLLDMHSKRGFFKNSKTALIPNPSPISSLLEEGKTKDKFCFLYIGQIEDHKGVLFLIKTWKKFRGNFLLPLNKPARRIGEGENKRGELLIVGDGSKMDELKKIVGGDNSIKILGRKNIEEVRKFMNNSDCLIIPSLCYENSPAVIYEAIGVGLPVLASRLGGIPELIDDDSLLFKAGDENDLINKMKWIMANENKVELKVESMFIKIRKDNQESYIKRLISL